MTPTELGSRISELVFILERIKFMLYFDKDLGHVTDWNLIAEKASVIQSEVNLLTTPTPPSTPS